MRVLAQDRLAAHLDAGYPGNAGRAAIDALRHAFGHYIEIVLIDMDLIFFVINIGDGRSVAPEFFGQVGRIPIAPVSDTGRQVRHLDGGQLQFSARCRT